MKGILKLLFIISCIVLSITVISVYVGSALTGFKGAGDREDSDLFDFSYKCYYFGLKFEAIMYDILKYPAFCSALYAAAYISYAIYRFCKMH